MTIWRRQVSKLDMDPPSPTILAWAKEGVELGLEDPFNLGMQASLSLRGNASGRASELPKPPIKMIARAATSLSRSRTHE